MTVKELIEELEKQKELGYGNLKVYYDFGAMEVKKVEYRVSLDNNEGYINLDW